MTWVHAWQWLVANGMLRDLIAAVIGAVVAHLSAWRPWVAHKKRQQQIIAGQKQIADLLDPATPGGLHDLVTKKEDAR